MLWELRKIPAENTWSLGGTIRFRLPDSGFVGGVQLHSSATAVNDGRIVLRKWRLLDYLNSIVVLGDGSTPIKSYSGRQAHYSQFLDGGPAITDQYQNYGAGTNRQHSMINFGRWVKDRDYGLDLSQWPSGITIDVTNDGAAATWSTTWACEMYAWFLRDAMPGQFKGYFRTESVRKWTTVQAATEQVKLQTEGMLRRIIFQVDPIVDATQKDAVQLYHTLQNIRVTHKSKNVELFNGGLRDLWYAQLFERGKDVIQGMENYSTDDYGFRTGLGQTLAKAGINMMHSGTQNTYAPDITPGEDGGTQSRQCDSNNDQTSLLMAGLALENCAAWEYDTYQDISLCPSMASEASIELECKTQDESGAAGGVIEVLTDRVMVK